MTANEARPLNGWGAGVGAPPASPTAAREWQSAAPVASEPSRSALDRRGAENACHSAAATRNDPDPGSGCSDGATGGGGSGGGGRGGGEGEGEARFASEKPPPPPEQSPLLQPLEAGSRRQDGGSLDPTGVVSVSKSICSDDSEMSFPRVPAHQRVNVVFEDLEVVSNSFFAKEKKTLLHGVSGQFRAGELVAVMGPSGAGKTTLLNTISGFTSGMISGGSISFQHEDGRVTNKRRVVCYLTQDDHVQPLFTAREIVQQAADLKVGNRLSRKARGLLVDDMLETLGLSECGNTRASQLSGGQRKRLALAAELVDNPSVIFLDEPTTGLDMSTATQCAQLMRRIARSGRAVICTIHQPSENMLSMFDQLYLLANGHCVYRGSPVGIIPFLSNLGFQCPKYHNPADFMLEVANNEYGDAEEAMAEAVEQQSSEYPPPLPELRDYEANGKRKEDKSRNTQIEALITADNYQPSEWERFRVLVTRNLLLQHRDWVTTQIRLFAALITFLLVGLLFGKIGDNAERVYSNVGLLFMVIIYTCYTPEAPAILKYPDEIQVVKREWFNNWYQLYTYSFALLVSALPLHVMTSTITCSITYYMTGQLAEPMRFAHVTLAVILTSIGSESLGLQFGSLFLKKKIISLFLGCIHLAYMILFSGFLALKPEMPEWFNWGTKINHMHYSLNNIIVAIYQGRGRLTCPTEVLYCHLRESDSVLKLFGLANTELWHGFLALVIIIAFLRISAYITLNYNVKRVNL